MQKKLSQVFFATSIFVQRRDPSPSRTAFFLNKKNEKKTKKKEKSFLFFLPRKTQKIVFFIPFSHDYLVLRSIT